MAGRPRKQIIEPGNSTLDIDGSINDGPNVVDPASLDDGTGTGTDSDRGTDTGNDAAGKRGRGRPRGTGSATGKSGTGKKTPPLAVDGVSAILLSSHMMLASFTKVPELVIDKHEADALATGISRVSRHYDIGGMSEKTLDWFNMFQALALVYGTRAVAISGKIRANRKKPAPENDDTVISYAQFGSVTQ